MTPDVQATLTAVYLAHQGLQPSDGSGVRPEITEYAYDPSTSTYWALLAFVPTDPTLPVFQHLGTLGMFTQPASGAWSVAVGTEIPGICDEVAFFPSQVLTAWKAPAPPSNC